ncbi:DUF448 domain-containing protein [Flavisphingopyxis soli]
MRTLPNDTQRVTRKGKIATPPERRCILTGERDERGAMIRLALGPDGRLAPDVLAKAPGRGAWIAVTRDELETARLNGKLKGALARAFKGEPVIVPESLADDIATRLQAAMLDRLGLEARAGTLLTGADRVDGAARGGQVAMLLHAADASPDGRSKRDQSWRVGRGAEGSGLAGQILPVDRDALSMALGRDNVVHVALVDDRAAARVAAILDRWRNYLGCGKDTRNSGPTPDVAGAGPIDASGVDAPGADEFFKDDRS